MSFKQQFGNKAKICSYSYCSKTLQLFFLFDPEINEKGKKVNLTETDKSLMEGCGCGKREEGGWVHLLVAAMEEEEEQLIEKSGFPLGATLSALYDLECIEESEDDDGANTEMAENNEEVDTKETCVSPPPSVNFVPPSQFSSPLTSSSTRPPRIVFSTPKSSASNASPSLASLLPPKALSVASPTTPLSSQRCAPFVRLSDMN